MISISVFALDTTAPTIDFVLPTEDNGESINKDYTYINVTSTDANDITAFIDWNLSLVGWWRFNNETGENNTFFRDWSTFGNNGSCLSVTCPNYVTGKFDEAMRFDGINDYVSIPDSNSLDLAGNFTIEGWFKTEETYSNTSDYYHGILDKGSYQIYLDNSDGKLKLNLDSNETKSWSDLGDMSSWVYSLSVYNGELYAGGYFTRAWGLSVNRIAKWNGTAWSALGSGMNKEVYAITSYNGELYAGGWFTTAGGVIVNRLAKWNGTAWSIVGSGLNGGVSSLIVYNDELYVGGRFTTAGGVSANRIAKWDGTTWSALGSGMDDDVVTFAVYEGELYVGGLFTTAGGVIVNQIAKWDGTTWSALGSGMNKEVYAITSYNGEFYAAGYFTMAGGVSANRIAKWDGTTWSALGSGMDHGINTLNVYNGELVAGGDFTIVDGVSVNRIAKWNGTTWSALGSGMNNHVVSIAVYKNQLYAGGWFEKADDLWVYYFTKWSNGNEIEISSNTNVWSGWNHFAFVYNETDIILYVNGIFEKSETPAITITKNTLPLYIGKTYGSRVGGAFSGNIPEEFNGTIDEIKIWSRALSLAEIRASYDAGIYRLETDYINLADGTYYYAAYAQDLAGNVNQTEIRTLTIETVPPTITIQAPTNTIHTTTTVWFNATLNEVGSWCGYSLDGSTNVTMLNNSGNWNAKNISMTEGSHTVTFFCNDTVDNMDSEIIAFIVDTPPEITIQAPINNIYTTDSIWFNATLNEVGSWCGYSLDSATNVTMLNNSGNWNAKNVSMTEGSHTVTFSCNDTAGNMNASGVTILFTIDTPMIITIQSPLDSTYYTQSIWFNVTLNEPGSWCGYSLDGATNVSMSNDFGTWKAENSSMTFDSHSVKFFCNNALSYMSSIMQNFIVSDTIPCTDYCVNLSTNLCDSGCNGTNGCLFYDIQTKNLCDAKPFMSWESVSGLTDGFVQCCEGAPITAYGPDVSYVGLNPLTIEVGTVADATISVRNRDNFDNTFTITLDSTSNLKYWSWFGAHRNDYLRTGMEVYFKPYEQKYINVQIMGGTEGCFKGARALKVNVTNSFGLSETESIEVCNTRSKFGGSFKRSVPGLSTFGFVLILLLSGLLYSRKKGKL